MDKESVVASLARNRKIAVETMAGQRYIIERILHTDDEKHIHILKPKDVILEVDDIKEIDENDLGDAT
ncbi:hypothetical protein HUZ99_05590 [Staphylococcus sp. SS87]|nr:hypothetical protein [Staphylococcus singaporensis]MBO0927333.1 hypothetical protein [Staphylococcus sp. 30403_3112M30944]MBO0945064.1 hypothetical protein [Staphylococcus sp. 30402_3112M30943]MBO0963976.1 hypothetical protein [Staphylococcus sp. 30400_3112M30941]MBO0965804.1 hypothetical protein [Staphylococcus sp. 30401_3112M30942]MCS5348540.1 hypothetical protein [Staphylococcus aureus]UMT75831.1 hypothetical protein ML435_00675 [Staphylococcus roterodami]